MNQLMTIQRIHFQLLRHVICIENSFCCTFVISFGHCNIPFFNTTFMILILFFVHHDLNSFIFWIPSRPRSSAAAYTSSTTDFKALRALTFWDKGNSWSSIDLLIIYSKSCQRSCPNCQYMTYFCLDCILKCTTHQTVHLLHQCNAHHRSLISWWLLFPLLLIGAISTISFGTLPIDTHFNAQLAVVQGGGS